MPAYVVLPAVALIALVPATLAVFRPPAARQRDVVFWATLAVAIAGPTAWAASLADEGWRTGFGFALWVAVAATAAAYGLLALTDRSGVRLGPLVLPYLLVMAVLALTWGHAPERPLRAAVSGWLWIHIAVAVATYALVGLAAIAALAVVLQETALRWKRPTDLTRRLPAVSDGDRIAFRALGAAAVVLGVGLLTGIALDIATTGRWFHVDHKTVLSLAAFVVIVGLLAAHARWGLRGRRGARALLVAWLLLTLAYPGVKFVTDVLIGGGG
ncbi:MAG: cytochrome c biogenesis protein CcsA [Alphaproteobacteria bacterium]|nr:cytochrome c biogenesis protein CcsA [Alphaproteobacteria bacterium]